jgi:hypothetical protein
MHASTLSQQNHAYLFRPHRSFHFWDADFPELRVSALLARIGIPPPEASATVQVGPRNAIGRRSRLPIIRRSQTTRLPLRRFRWKMDMKDISAFSSPTRDISRRTTLAALTIVRDVGATPRESGTGIPRAVAAIKTRVDR